MENRSLSLGFYPRISEKWRLPDRREYFEGDESKNAIARHDVSVTVRSTACYFGNWSACLRDYFPASLRVFA